MIKYTYHYDENYVYIAKMLVENDGDSKSGTGYVNFPPEDDNKFNEYKLINNKWEPFIDIEIIKLKITSSIQMALNSFAKLKGYSSIEAACSYSNSSIESFKSDALICINLRDQTWIKYFDILKSYEDGKITFTSYDDIKSQLPELVWPKD